MRLKDRDDVIADETDIVADTSVGDGATFPSEADPDADSITKQINGALPLFRRASDDFCSPYYVSLCFIGF